MDKRKRNALKRAGRRRAYRDRQDAKSPVRSIRSEDDARSREYLFASSAPQEPLPTHLYLDDERETPEGWTPVRYVYDMIARLKTGEVEYISLDWWLGCGHATGDEVLRWMLQAVREEGFAPPEIHIHTSCKDKDREMRWLRRQISIAHRKNQTAEEAT